MNADDFAFFQKFLRDKSGMALGDDKLYLLESRLSPVMRKWMFGNLEEMARALRLTPDKKLVSEVINAMVTNETLFFRDDRPFKHFRTNMLPSLLEARKQKKSIRVWSAACSTGQEPYSIAMTALETIPRAEVWNVEILGTDISEHALNQAMKGEYTQFEIQRGLPMQMAMKYFQQQGQGWRVNDKIRSMIRYEAFNLLDRMEKFGSFDVIFCRNVLIYFDEATKKHVLDNLISRLAPDGYLFLGGAESVINICPNLKAHPDCPGLYTVASPSKAKESKPVTNTIALKPLVKV